MSAMTAICRSLIYPGPMKAWTLSRPAPIERNPLELRDVPPPDPGEREVRVRVNACGICRTDLHIVEGELPPKSPDHHGLAFDAWAGVAQIAVDDDGHTYIEEHQSIGTKVAPTC